MDALDNLIEVMWEIMARIRFHEAYCKSPISHNPSCAYDYGRYQYNGRVN